MNQQHHCRRCGGTLTLTDGVYTCLHCKAEYSAETAERNTSTLQELFDAQRRERIHNLRRILYDAVNAPYISRTDVVCACDALREFLPGDFTANFYRTVASGNLRQINAAIRGVDVERQREDMDDVVTFLIRSVSGDNDFLLALGDLVERAYKAYDLSRYSQFTTLLSEQAERVRDGVYETALPRDVFIAYSSKDSRIVLDLVEELEEQGISCFVALRNLRHGIGSVENYDAALKEAMDSCTIFLFVSSMNSRNLQCDAVRVEMMYIKGQDIDGAPSEYGRRYEKIPHKYKKPRVEYRIEESTRRNIADATTNQFFDGYERVYEVDGVLERIAAILMNDPAVDHDLNRIEEEARQRAEAETRRIEEETRRRIEEETRRRVEEETRRRAEEETRRRVEEETRRRVEEELRLRDEEAAMPPAEEQTPPKLPEKVRPEVGQTLTLGMYEQNPGAGKEPIEWLVLAAEGERALVISRYVLDTQRFHADPKRNAWSSSALRGWLNGAFLHAAFSVSDQACIVSTTNRHDRARGERGGQETNDKLFLFTVDEAYQYFASNEARQAAPSGYAKARGVQISRKNGKTQWWLRSSGTNAGCASVVYADGGISQMGANVSSNTIGVRPAMWVDLSAYMALPDASSAPAASALIIPAVGGTFRFGSYRQTRGRENEPIEWLVLARDNERALIISRDILDVQSYHSTRDAVAWETCSLRRWLNGTFLENGFSPTERKRIRATNIRNPRNTTYNTSGGNDTVDAVFCLSMEEVRRYFTQEIRLSAHVTAAVRVGGKIHLDASSGNASWWLRSPGKEATYAAEVMSFGGASAFGSIVSECNGIRPAMWISLWDSDGTSVPVGTPPVTPPTPKPSPPVPPSTAKPTPKPTPQAVSRSVTPTPPLAPASSVPPSSTPTLGSVGSIVTLGSYPQNSNGGKAPIEWIVVARKADRALVISKYILDFVPYNTGFTTVSWAACSLRKWLNNTFMNDTFSPSERTRIITTEIKNPQNPKHGTNGGYNTTDSIFCLSIAEMDMIDITSAAKQTCTTAYLKEKYSGRAEYGWWLRSPGDRANRAAYAYLSSVINYYGLDVHNDLIGVRPAMWITMSESTASSTSNANSTPKPVPQAARRPSTNRKSSLVIPSPGGTFRFGHYTQTTGSKKELIEWLVLARDGDRSLVVSTCILACQSYNTSSKSVTWENCTLRQWLNHTFLHDAFSDTECSHIHTSEIPNLPNTRYHVDGGNHTTDKLFCLSIDEARRYFKSERAKTARVTQAIRAQGKIEIQTGKNTASWWLRSPGATSTDAAYIINNGSECLRGIHVTYSRIGVRPAMWLKNES